MIVVLIITTIVVAMAFSVLTLVQRQMKGIESNLERGHETRKLQQQLWVDFHRYGEISINTDQLYLKNSIDSVTYKIDKEFIVRERDTFKIGLSDTAYFFDGKQVQKGSIDALEWQSLPEFGNRHIFIYKNNDTSQYMTHGF